MKKFISKLVNTESSAALMLILPAVVGTFIFIIIPVLCSFGLSFAKWDLLGSVSFVGLDNYRLIFSEKIFYKILTNTVVFALSTSIFGVIIPLILAAILNSKIIDWYYRFISVQLGSNAVRMFSIYMLQIPIPNPNKIIEKQINDYVDLLSNNEINESVNHELEKLISNLYGLTNEEYEYIANS